jgi:hypothetical protein
MGDVVPFPKRKTGNAELKIEAIPVYEAPDLKKEEADVRMQRIQESLRKINQLMRELKGKVQYDK